MPRLALWTQRRCGNSKTFSRNQSRSSTTNALRAAVNPAPSVPGARTNAFRKPDPQTGPDVPSPAKLSDPPNLPSSFDETIPEHVFFDPWDISGSWPRRALRPPVDPLPRSFTFTTAEVRMRISRPTGPRPVGLRGRTNRSHARGTATPMKSQTRSLSSSITLLLEMCLALLSGS